jgi:hypothetical protein
MDRSARIGVKELLMNSRLCWGIFLFLAVAASAAAEVVGSPGIHKEPVVVADSAGDHLVAAWIHIPDGDDKKAEVQISRSSVLPPFTWSAPYTLNAAERDPLVFLPGSSGDPFLVADPTPGSHTVYISTVSGGLQQIVLWTYDNTSLPTPSLVCNSQGGERLDKPAVAASKNTLYVTHMVGPDTVHIHTRPRKTNTAQWTTTTLQFMLIAPDIPSGREVRRDSLFSPLILVQDGDTAEKVTIIIEDWGKYKFFVQSTGLESKSNALLAWSVNADQLVSGEKKVYPKHAVYPDGSVVPRPDGYAVYRTSRLIPPPDLQHPDYGRLPNTNFHAESMLMAQGSTNLPTIGIVWHEREAFDETSAAEVKFIAYDSRKGEFLGTCEPKAIGEDLPCVAKPVVSDLSVAPGNQFHPAIAVSPDGEFLITYYDSQSAADPVDYTVKASTRIGNAVRTDISVDNNVSDTQNYSTAIGEYQGVTYSAGHWYSAFIAVHDGKASVKVNEVQLTSLPTCSNKTSFLVRCYNPTLAVHDGATLRLPTILEDNRDPADYTFAYIDRSQNGLGVLSTDLSYNRVVKSSLMMTLFASQRHGDECDSLPVDVGYRPAPCTGSCIATPYCKRRVVAHQATLSSPGEPYQLHAPIGVEYVDGAKFFKWRRQTASEPDVVFSTAKDPIDYPIVDTSYWVEEDNGIWAESFNTDDVKMKPDCPLIAEQPQDVVVERGNAARLDVGVFPAVTDATYTWYEGALGNTSTPVGGNSSELITPPLDRRRITGAA